MSDQLEIACHYDHLQFMKRKCATSLFACSTPLWVNKDSNEGLACIKGRLLSGAKQYNNVAGLIRTSVHIEVKGELHNTGRIIIAKF